MNNLFLPNPQKKTRPLLLQPKLLTAYSLILIIGIFGVKFLVNNNQEILGYASDINSFDLLKYTNEIRDQKGLENLTLNSKLNNAAEQKAKDMFEDDYWAHTAPDGKEPWDFIKGQGYYYVYAGENLAVDFSESKDVVQAWYDSKSHRDNLLNPNYSEIGFAVVNGELQGRKTTIVVQMFGMPRVVQPSVASDTDTQTNVAKVPEEISPIENSEVVENIIDTNLIDDLVSVESSSGAVLNSTDVFNVSRFISIIMGLFITALFVVDGYYIRKYGIDRITGHTLLHIVLLILVMIGIWYTNIGLVL